MFVWMSWNFASFREILNPNKCWKSQLSILTNKKVLFLKKTSTMYHHGQFFLQTTDVVLSLNSTRRYIWLWLWHGFKCNPLSHKFTHRHWNLTWLIYFKKNFGYILSMYVQCVLNPSFEFFRPRVANNMHDKV